MEKKTIFLAILLFLTLIFIGWLISIRENYHFSHLFSRQINGQKVDKRELWVDVNKILVEIADNNLEQARGLSGRDFLEENEGMLFIFEKTDFHRFWMKDMRIPLDFIWIQEDEIIDITENVPPPQNSSGQMPTYSPKEPVNKVLEVNAGWVQKHNIKIGDKIKF